MYKSLKIFCSKITLDDKPIHLWWKLNIGLTQYLAIGFITLDGKYACLLKDADMQWLQKKVLNTKRHRGSSNSWYSTKLCQTITKQWHNPIIKSQSHQMRAEPLNPQDYRKHPVLKYICSPEQGLDIDSLLTTHGGEYNCIPYHPKYHWWYASWRLTRHNTQFVSNDCAYKAIEKLILCFWILTTRNYYHWWSERGGQTRSSGSPKRSRHQLDHTPTTRPFLWNVI
jgi:hypothetical protein